MLAQKWALGLVCALSGISLSSVTGCSSKSGPGAAHEADAGDAGHPAHATAKATVEDEDDAGAPDAGRGVQHADPVEQDAGPRCNSTVLDDPDDDFADTNCDGIDGDKKKAIFVATNGNDTADGSWGKPVASIKHGIELAVTARKDVYVCKGEYAEATVQLGIQGVRVYGGYDCTQGWTRNSNSQARLVSTSNMAVSINGVADAVVFDHVDISSARGMAASDSSIAVLVSNSANVTLRRGTYAAADGADAVQPVVKSEAANSIPNCAAYVYPSGCYGEPGTDAYQFKNCFYDSTQGATFYGSAPFNDTSVFQLAPESSITQVNHCANSLSYGGRGGGTNANQPLSGSSGTPGFPALTTGSLDGANGSAGTAVAAATQGFGSLSSSGYLPSNQGQVGNPGQMGEAGTGGDGGGFATIFNAGTGDFPYSAYAPRAGGGKGGWAGCPGDGGSAGNAGGASIAVAIYQSQVSIERLTLTTSKGGRGSAGGLGGLGASGQPGGSPGSTHYQCATCVSSQAKVCDLVGRADTGSASWGGKGGKGGDGSQGGPGGGGPSIPLATFGLAPTISLVTFLPGSGGVGGSNGGPRAADGESVDQKVIP